MTAADAILRWDECFGKQPYRNKPVGKTSPEEAQQWLDSLEERYLTMLFALAQSEPGVLVADLAITRPLAEAIQFMASDLIDCLECDHDDDPPRMPGRRHLIRFLSELCAKGELPPKPDVNTV